MTKLDNIRHHYVEMRNNLRSRYHAEYEFRDKIFHLTYDEEVYMDIYRDLLYIKDNTIHINDDISKAIIPLIAIGSKRRHIEACKELYRMDVNREILDALNNLLKTNTHESIVYFILHFMASPDMTYVEVPLFDIYLDPYFPLDKQLIKYLCLSKIQKSPPIKSLPYLITEDNVYSQIKMEQKQITLNNVKRLLAYLPTIQKEYKDLQPLFKFIIKFSNMCHIMLRYTDVRDYLRD